MSLATLLVLETVVDLATVVLSLWALSRCVPPEWKAGVAAAFQKLKLAMARPPKAHPAPDSSTGRARSQPFDQVDPVNTIDIYGQIPILAATGLSLAQIVQKLGLSRGEVELALKMRRCSRQGAHG